MTRRAAALGRGARFDGKVALVTGGASGIGYATALALSREGALVVLADRDTRRGAVAADDLALIGGAVEFQELDAGEESSWRAALARVRTIHGPLDLLVNNAYSGRATPFATLDATRWRDAARVNIEGALCGMRLAAEAMTGGGAIVNVASVGAFRGAADNAAYVAAKLALISLTQSAALAYASRRPPVRVNAVAPGVTDTPALDGLLKARGTDPEGLATGKAALANGVPLGRIAAPAEIASAILFLASEEASYINGHCLVVDGGAIIAP